MCGKCIHLKELWMWSNSAVISSFYWKDAFLKRQVYYDGGVCKNVRHISKEYYY